MEKIQAQEKLLRIPSESEPIIIYKTAIEEDRSREDKQALQKAVIDSSPDHMPLNLDKTPFCP